MPVASMVEDHPHVPFAARRARRGHPDQGGVPAGPGEPHGVLDRPWGPHALEGLVRAAHDDGLAELRSVRLRAEHGRELLVGLLWVHHLVGAEAESLFPLPVVLGDADYAPGAGQLL